MSFKVTRNIRDTQDDNRLYLEGEIFPRKGFKPSEERIAELLDKGVIAEDKSKRTKKTKTKKNEA